MRRRRTLSWLLVPAMLVIGGPAASSAATPLSHAHVLMLLPGGSGLPAASLIATGIRTSLVSDWSFPMGIEMEYVNSTEVSGSEVESRRLREQLAAKYRTRNIDLVVAASGPALRFALRARDDIWPGTPIVGCVVDERSVAGLALPPDVRIVSIRYDARGTLSAALALLPETHHVALVGGAAPQEEEIHELARQAVRAASRRLDLIDLTKLPIEEVMTRVSTLPRHSIILMSSYQADATGRTFYAIDVVGPLSKTANSPVFSAFGQALGRGIVGGSLTDFEAVGREAGTVALRVLRGEPLPASTAASTVGSALRFDARELARWRLDQRRLPPGSIVMYGQPSLWQQYRGYVVVAIAVTFVQAALIALLLVERRHRRAAQVRLAERLRFEALVTEVAVALSSMPTLLADDEVSSCLGRIGTFLGVDRVTMWQPSANGALSITHSWCAEGVPPPPPTIDMRRFPYARALTERADGGMSFRRLEDLPQEAAAERAAFEGGGVRSFAAIPLHAADRPLGLLTLVCVRAERAWPKDLMQQLRTLAELFSDALVLAQNAAAMENSEAFTGAVLAALPGETAIIDAAGTILQTNDAWAKAAQSMAPGAQGMLSVNANYLEACRKAIGMPADIARKAHASVAAILEGQREELSLEYPTVREGTDHWFELRVRRLPRLGGGAAVMHFDVTARRQAEAAVQRHVIQIAHLDRVAAMGQLASSIAHELNQPLTAILVNAQASNRMLAGAEPDLEELRACLVDIIADDQRAAEVIRRMRRLLKKTEPVRLPLALNDLVSNTISLVANDALLHAVSIDFVPAPALPLVHGDLVQIQQVILNLLTNAIAAAAASMSTRKVAVWTAVISPPYVEVGVHDSGSGITQEDRSRLFEPFFTTKSDGLGMGLAISRTIVEAHGGRLTGENDPAGGATFRLHLSTEAGEPA